VGPASGTGEHDPRLPPILGDSSFGISLARYELLLRAAGPARHSVTWLGAGAVEIEALTTTGEVGHPAAGKLELEEVVDVVEAA